jgi:hypothetical protein
MQKGFFASLFDVSFSSLITTKVIKAIYVLSMVVIGLVGLVFLLAAVFSENSGGAEVVFALIVVPVVALIYLVYTRVLLEVIIVLFRIMETNVELVELQRAATSPASAPPPPPSSPPESPTA